jgi:multidrug efflux pump subunit AcrA (membrane-fusion protein)
MSNKFWMILGVVFILGFAGSACSGDGRTIGTPTPLPPLVEYEQEIFTVEQGSIISEKELRGEIVPAKQDRLFFRASGFVTRVTVKQGDLVEEGDVLAELQVDDLLAQLQQAQIDLEVSKAELEKFENQRAFDVSLAQAEVTIAEKLLDIARLEADKATDEEKDAASLNLDIAEQNLIKAQVNLSIKEQETSPYLEQVVQRNQLSVQRLESLLSEHQIRAPYDGIILEVDLREGKNQDGYQPVIDIGDPSDLVVRTQPDWELRGKLTGTTETHMFLSKAEADVNQTWLLTFMPRFFPFSESETDSSQSSSDYFYFDLHDEEENEAFQVGQSVFLTVILGRKDAVLLLPPAAIREYKGLHFVIVQDEDRRRRVEINSIGLKTPQLWEIDGDLQPGDQVFGP